MTDHRLIWAEVTPTLWETFFEFSCSCDPAKLFQARYFTGGRPSRHDLGADLLPHIAWFKIAAALHHRGDPDWFAQTQALQDSGAPIDWVWSYLDA